MRSPGPPGNSTDFITAPAQQSSDLLLAINTSALEGRELESARAYLNAVYSSLRGGAAVQMSVLNEGSVATTGNFRSAAQFRNALRTLPASGGSVAGPPEFAAELTDSLSALPALNEWSWVLVVGKIPDFTSGADPDLMQYTVAWLTQQMTAGKEVFSSGIRPWCPRGREMSKDTPAGSRLRSPRMWLRRF